MPLHSTLLPVHCHPFSQYYITNQVDQVSLNKKIVYIQPQDLPPSETILLPPDLAAAPPALSSWSCVRCAALGSTLSTDGCQMLWKAVQQRHCCNRLTSVLTADSPSDLGLACSVHSKQRAHARNCNTTTRINMPMICQCTHQYTELDVLPQLHYALNIV